MAPEQTEPKSALHAAAVTAYRAGDMARAEANIREALALSPEDPVLLHSAGLILQRTARDDEALAAFDRALARAPDFADAANSRGNLLRRLGRLPDALASYRQAIAGRPDSMEAHHNCGVAYFELGRAAEALACFEQARALRPGHPEIEKACAKALGAVGRVDQGIATLDAVLAAQPEDLDARNTRGVLLKAARRLDEAAQDFAHVLAVRPDHAQAHLNRAHLRLLRGDYAGAWDDYEWRWHSAQMSKDRRDWSAPPLTDQDDVADKTVLVFAEQGFGDTIQFCRYVPLLTARGARVVLEVQPALLRLLATLEGAERVLSRGTPLPAHEFQCAVMSLPRAFRTTLETVPAQVPYLRAPTALAETWRQRLHPLPRPRIGIAWTGDPRHPHDAHRSVPLSLIETLNAGALVSLQKDVRPGDRARIANGGRIHDFSDGLNDFADTAALVDQLDAVVTIDSVMAHLAGAMAKPTALMLPFLGLDWRWLLDRADSPWYPSLRLFRQAQPGAWGGVLTGVQAFIDGIA